MAVFRVCALLYAAFHHFVVAAQVKVKRRGDDQKFIAEVLAIGTECDIALLTVKDEAFWEGVSPLSFGPLPRLQVFPSGKTSKLAAPQADTLSQLAFVT